MKKLFIILLGLITLVGCGKSMSATDAVSDYLEKYRSNDDEIIRELNDYISNEDMNDIQKEKYRDVLLKQYRNIKYQITNESYENDVATISVRINVFDLYRAQVDANAYLSDHLDKFTDANDMYNKSMFLDYKLDLMSKYTDSVEYDIDFHVKKVDGKWVVESLSNDDLEKIHGIYHFNS